MREEVETNQLEEQIRGLDGVLGAVVFKDSAGNPVEIQVFTRSGSSEPEIRRSIAELLARRGKGQTAERVFLFALAGQPPSGPRVGAPNVAGAVGPHEVTEPKAPEPEAPEPEPSPSRQKRPKIGRISLASSGPTSLANVSLTLNGRQAEGMGRARKTPYGLRVTAAATLEAAQALIGEPGLLALEGASLVEAVGRRLVVVLVHSALEGGRMVLGAALVGDTPVHEATVRATLDAVNRQLELVLAE
ncbi:MAG: hypothetical protein ACRDI1_07530 [Actinomycetota bacterium]